MHVENMKKPPKGKKLEIPNEIKPKIYHLHRIQVRVRVVRNNFGGNSSTTEMYKINVFIQVG